MAQPAPVGALGPRTERCQERLAPSWQYRGSGKNGGGGEKRDPIGWLLSMACGAPYSKGAEGRRAYRGLWRPSLFCLRATCPLPILSGFSSSLPMPNVPDPYPCKL